MKAILFILIAMPLLSLTQNNQIAFKTFTMQGNTCAGFQSPTGSLIFIPPDAFKLEDGSSCNGVVTVKYREFHSQTDMYYSGMNMIWDDNGKYRMLESVGMFEIQAWCGDKRLTLNSEKSIQVRMKCRRNLENLYSFIYNTAKNKWSKYPAEVMDFSYRKKNNKADSSAVWGSGSFLKTDSVQSFWVAGDGNEYATTVAALAPKLPEGYFKGIDIKNLGIFNYDGVIKDSLAVPMIPEMYVQNETAVALNQEMYVFYEGRNTLVHYYPGDYPERFVLLNVKGIRMFTVFKDGAVATISTDETNKLNLEEYRNKVIKLSFKREPMRPKNKNDLATVTGLKTE